MIPPVISAKRKRWVLPAPADPAAVERLARELGLPTLIAELLIRRGHANGAAAGAFLNPQLKTLHDPWLLPEMKRAVERLAAAIRAGEKILLFGDYDVDGITGTAMLWHLLKAAGVANVETYTPHRVQEGYGISQEAMEKSIANGAQLIVSIDCGVSANAAIAAAQARGIDVIVTDHHEFGAELPPALAIVHPRVNRAASGGDEPAATYPNHELCGAGVAFKLAWALAAHLCGGGKVSAVYRDLLVEFTALVALATIADVVPLTGENRVLVKFGLSQLPRTSLAGLKALMAAAGYAGQRVDTTAVGFGLAPRLNAAGRMDHASLAVELLTTATKERAKEIAEYLETQNRDRQSTEKRMLEEARAQVEQSRQTAVGSEAEKSAQQLPHVIVVHSRNHHAGVVGIVASRLVELYNRPAFVLALDDGAENNPPTNPPSLNSDPGIVAQATCHGSARSIPGFELHQAIEHCRSLLISGGGHAMAAGVKLAYKNLESFRSAVNEFAAGVLTEDHFTPALHLDGEWTLREATLESVARLSGFEPFGRGNPHPRFVLRQVRLAAPPRAVGATGAHLQMQFSQGKSLARGIAFKAGPLAIHNELYVGLELDLVVEPKVDEFNGRQRVDFIIVDMARCDGVALELGDT